MELDILFADPFSRERNDTASFNNLVNADVLLIRTPNVCQGGLGFNVDRENSYINSPFSIAVSFFSPDVYQSLNVERGYMSNSSASRKSM